MHENAWLQVMHRVPRDKYDSLSVLMSTGTELVLQQVYRVENDFMIARARTVGTMDMGRVIVIPYAQIDFMAFNKPILEEEVLEIFGAPFVGVASAPAPAAPASVAIAPAVPTPAEAPPAPEPPPAPAPIAEAPATPVQASVQAPAAAPPAWVPLVRPTPRTAATPPAPVAAAPAAAPAPAAAAAEPKNNALSKTMLLARLRERLGETR